MPHIVYRKGRWICVSLWATGIGKTAIESWRSWENEQDLHIRRVNFRQRMAGMLIL